MSQFIKQSPYPNTSEFTLFANQKLVVPCEIRNFDISGKLVYSQILSKEGLTFNIQLTELKSGIYFYQIRTENNELLKRDKIILIR